MNWRLMAGALAASALLFGCGGGTTEPTCDSGQVVCDSLCIDTQTDDRNCGGCGTVCAAGQTCTAGSCTVACPPGQTLCNGTCQTLEASRDNCGACGNACGDGEVCVSGACATSCGAGTEDCDGTCRDTTTDRANCGGCGTPCGADQVCNNGNCELLCATGLTDCSGTCRDTDADRNNCGACGTVCDTDEVCNAGVCELSCTGFSPDACNGSCTNTQVDAANCGTCGNACGSGEICSAGVCANTCDASLSVCGGLCTSTQNDPANCGTCGTVCTSATNATAVCATGSCDRVCQAGYGDCDQDLASTGSTGCEITLATSVDHCGACGNACAAPANGTASCVAGACGIAACDTDFDNCDNDVATGCEANLLTDNSNCGGCNIACTGTDVCQAGVCAPMSGPGEDCGREITLTAGANTVTWLASVNNYMTANPSCMSFSTTTGPDVVLKYASTINGSVTVSFDKPTNTRWSAITSDQACGTTTELACVSEYTASSMAMTFNVTSGTDYFIYVVDTASGTNPLDNPLIVNVSELNCATFTPTFTLSPATGSTTSNLNPVLVATSDAPFNDTAGTITVTGTLGTNLSFTLPSTSVTFSTDKKTMTIDPGITFPAGENVTVSWSGLTETTCSTSVAPPTWTFTVPVPPCAPGTNGMVGTTITRLPLGVTFTGEYYVAADNAPAGYVYVGGLSSLYRLPKAGGAAEAVHTLAGLTSTHLGYTMLVDGQNIYTVDSTTSGTTGYVWRITSDGGATWSLQDMATFPQAPGDDFRGIAAHGGKLYLITEEFSGTHEIWEIDTTGTLPAAATIAHGFPADGSYTYCNALVVDSTNYYTRCRKGSTGSIYAVLRINRTTGVMDELTLDFPGSTTASDMRMDDVDADGVADILYTKDDDSDSYYVCAPNTAAPYASQHFTYSTATGNYGLGFDSVAKVLWAYDDDTSELVRIQ